MKPCGGLFGELQHVDPGLDRHRSVLEVELEDPVHELDVDEDPWRSGTAPSVSPVPPARGTTGIRSRFASHDLGDLLGRGGEDDDVGHVVVPAVHRERRGDARSVESRRAPGEDVLFAADRDELVEDGVGDRDGRHVSPPGPPTRRQAPSGRRPRSPAARPARRAAAPTTRTPRRACRPRAPSPARPAAG